MNFIVEVLNSFWCQSLIKIMLGCILAGIIGLERSSWNKPAGFRTHSLVGMSAVLIMLCGEYMSKEYNIDPSRIPAQLLSGIGFIGAGFYLGGILTTLIAYLILSYSYKISDRLDHFNLLELEIEISKNTNEVLGQIENIFSEYNVDIKHIKRPKKDEIELNSETVHIVGQYAKKGFKKNELFSSISALPYVTEIVED